MASKVLGGLTQLKVAKAMVNLHLPYDTIIYLSLAIMCWSHLVPSEVNYHPIVECPHEMLTGFH